MPAFECVLSGVSYRINTAESYGSQVSDRCVKVGISMSCKPVKLQTRQEALARGRTDQLCTKNSTNCSSRTRTLACIECAILPLQTTKVNACDSAILVYGSLKGKVSPHSIAERRVPELILVLGSQPAGDVSHKPGGRLPLLSARPAVTLATW